MEKIKARRELKERFKELYKGKRLLALNLNGFTHSVWYDSGNKDSAIEQEVCSAYTGGMNGFTSKAQELFKGYANYVYQNNAVYITYIEPEKR